MGIEHQHMTRDTYTKVLIFVQLTDYHAKHGV